MSKLPAALSYTVLRLAFFLVPLGAMLLTPIFQEYWWLAIILSALIGLSLSIVFLSGLRERTASNLERRRAKRVTPAQADAAAEDAAVDEG